MFNLKAKFKDFPRGAIGAGLGSAIYLMISQWVVYGALHLMMIVLGALFAGLIFGNVSLPINRKSLPQNLFCGVVTLVIFGLIIVFWNGSGVFQNNWFNSPMATNVSIWSLALMIGGGGYLGHRYLPIGRKG